MNEFLEENLVNSAQIRLDLNENLHKEALNIRKEFKEIFKIEPKIFTQLKDLKYYREGYLNVDTPAKIDTFCDKIANLLQLSAYVGDTELKDKLASRGIIISIQEPTQYNTNLSSAEARDAFSWLMDRALENQQEICQQARKIKIFGYKDFVEESGEEIQKSDYLLCVKNKYNELKNLDNTNIIEDINRRKLSIEITEKYI